MDSRIRTTIQGNTEGWRQFWLVPHHMASDAQEALEYLEEYDLNRHYGGPGRCFQGMAHVSLAPKGWIVEQSGGLDI